MTIRRENSAFMLACAAVLASACGSKTQVTGGGNPQPVVACPLDQATGPDYACGLLSRNGNQLMLGGKNYRSVGFNRYELAGGPNMFGNQCQHSTDANAHAVYVNGFMQKAASYGATVVRFWAFQQFAGTNGTDYSDFETVIAAAKHYGLRVVPVLENNWSDCSQPSALAEKDPNFYSTGYKSPYGYTLSLPDYVHGVVSHFKDEPAIAMWQVLNEGKLYQAPKTLAAFITDIAQQIKAIDPNHLVSGGGSLQCWQGAQGVTDFKSYAASDAVDVLDQHDYYSPSVAWPDCLEGALQAAKGLNKPLVIAEVGISTKASEDNVPRDVRPSYFNAKMQAASSKGVQQYLIWSYNSDPHYEDGFDLLEEDPSLPVFQNASQSVFGD